MNDDLKSLQGVWNVSSLEVDGQKMPEHMLANGKIVIQGSRFTSTGMGPVYEGMVTLDASSNPRHIDMTFDAGPEKGNTNLGIYKLDGDTWTLCLAMRGSVRPSKFATTNGSGFALESLTRGSASPSAKAKRPSSQKAPKQTVEISSGVKTEFEGEWQMVSGVMSGAAMDAASVQWVKRITVGNQTTVHAGPQTILKVTFTHDRSKLPQTLTYVITAGSGKGKTQMGIYEFEGDLLRICMSAPGSPSAPAQFESQRGDGRTLTAWKRLQ